LCDSVLSVTSLNLHDDDDDDDVKFLQKA